MLDAAASAGSAPLSGAMRRKLTDLCSAAHSMFSDERTYLSRNGVHLKVRPCIVERISDTLAPDGGLQVRAFVIATYGGTPITDLPDLTQHFAVAVGDTAPWPSPDATVIRPSPDYPKSRETPVYLIAHPIDIPLSSFVDKYTLGPAEPGGRDRGPCSLSYQQQFLLDNVAAQRDEAYRGKPFRELIAWNDSWEVHNRERQKRFSGTGPAASVNAGTSNAASERSGASARTRPTAPRARRQTAIIRVVILRRPYAHQPRHTQYRVFLRHVYPTAVRLSHRVSHIRLLRPGPPFKFPQPDWGRNGVHHKVSEFTPRMDGRHRSRRIKLCWFQHPLGISVTGNTSTRDISNRLATPSRIPSRIPSRALSEDISTSSRCHRCSTLR